DDSVLCWGSESPEGLFQTVRAGNENSCGIKKDGTLACWGGPAPDAFVVPSGTFSSLSSERQLHFCAVRTDETIVCWWDRGVGPTPPSGAFHSVYASNYDNCALRKDDNPAVDNTLTCWGSDSPNPQWVAPTGTFQQVSVANYHGCGLHTNAVGEVAGIVECWG